MLGTCCEPLALLLAEREPSACRHAKPSARFAETRTRSSSYDEPAGGLRRRHGLATLGGQSWGGGPGSGVIVGVRRAASRRALDLRSPFSSMRLTPAARSRQKLRRLRA